MCRKVRLAQSLNGSVIYCILQSSFGTRVTTLVRTGAVIATSTWIHSNFSLEHFSFLQKTSLSSLRWITGRMGIALLNSYVGCWFVTSSSYCSQALLLIYSFSLDRCAYISSHHKLKINQDALPSLLFTFMHWCQSFSFQI